MAFVVWMIWGEVLIYLDRKLIPRIENYFRRRREIKIKRNGVKDDVLEGKSEHSHESC